MTVEKMIKELKMYPPQMEVVKFLNDSVAKHDTVHVLVVKEFDAHGDVILSPTQNKKVKKLVII